MTLDSIDQAVDMVLAGLIYGSGTWFVCAFGLYVVSRRRKRQSMRPVLLLAPALEPAVVEPFELDDSLSEAIVLTGDERIDVAPNIEIIIEQPLLIAPAAQPELFPEKSIEKVPGKESMGKKAIEKESIEGIEEKPVAADKPASPEPEKPAEDSPADSGTDQSAEDSVGRKDEELSQSSQSPDEKVVEQEPENVERDAEAEQAAAVEGEVGKEMLIDRSEERRVGKACRSRWAPYH